MSTATHLQSIAAKPKPLGISAHAGLLLQRKCACGSPTASLTGECTECKNRKLVQTKLAIGASNDPLELEADRIANQVLATPAHSSVSSAPPRIQRYARQTTEGTDTAPASVDRVLAGAGRPLNPALRQDMEQRFGHDFSRVRVHSDAAAEQSSREVNAHAYTVGRNVVFGAGQFAPETHEGRRLLAHELTHVVQQSSGVVAIQQKPADDKRPENDVEAARRRGRLIAKRIRVHTRVSKEVRATINSELASLDGAAKEAYLDEVRPALLAVTPIEMPEVQARRELPPVRKPSLDSLVDPRSLCGGRDCAEIDTLINAPLKEMEDRDKAELTQRKDVQLQALRTKTDAWKQNEDFMRDTLKQPAKSEWREDQAFALELLDNVLQRNVAPDPRGVSDAIRAPILQRYEAWLKRTDAKAFDEKKGAHARGVGELAELQRLLRIFRGADHTAVDTVYSAVLEYRKKTDPYWLWSQGYASAMVNAGVSVAGGAGQRANRKSPPAEEPAPPKPAPQAQLPAAPANEPAGIKPPPASVTPPTAPATPTQMPAPTTVPAKQVKTSAKVDKNELEETRSTVVNEPVEDAPGAKGEKKVTAKKVEKPKAKDAAEESEDPKGGKKARTDDKPKPAKPAPAAVPEDPQQGVKDAITRADQRIAAGRVEIDNYNTKIATAREKANTLRENLKNTPRGDPGREKAVRDLKQAEKKVDELVAQRDEGPIARNQADQVTKIRLQKALDEQTYARPPWRTDMRQKVWDNAMKEGNGKVLSPSRKQLQFEDDWVIGHKPKYEFRKHQESAAKRGISREQFRDEYNRDAKHYRPETTADNSSRKYEDRTDAYLGF
jgi:hypothetical protein